MTGYAHDATTSVAKLRLSRCDRNNVAEPMPTIDAATDAL